MTEHDETAIRVKIKLNLDGIVADATKRAEAKLGRLITKTVERAVEECVEKQVKKVIHSEILSALMEADVRALTHATAKRRLEIALAEMDKLGR